ncbi:Rne/Rng family ribonuclease [Metabacillus sp. Hm71]|uniref:Rne/Rng family ribonuclease n=1 Tax=Metabacillus sp. Hm71 TaxID=3450743 RepID=UPI003F42FBEE
MRKLFINEKTNEFRCAVVEENQLTEIHQTNSYQDEVVGNIFVGRVTKVLPGMQAAFVDIGLKQNGYLHRNDLISFQHEVNHGSKTSISHYVREGDQLLVQVVKEGTDQKGPKLTTNLEFGGKFLVYMPFGDYLAVSKKLTDEAERNRLLTIADELRKGKEGLLFRTASLHKTKEELTEEYIKLKKQFTSLSRKNAKVPECIFEARSFVDRIVNELALHPKDMIICDQIETVQHLKQQYPNVTVMYHDQKEGIFSTHKIEQEIDKLLKQTVWLKNGAFIVIEQTEAMTIIDVNTGKFSGKSSMRDTVLKTNQAAAIEIAKQIRLRNLSGIILIDFIDMRYKEDQEVIVDTVTREMKRDRVQHKIIGFTELNILQITRKKVRGSIQESLTNRCEACHGTGRIPSAESVTYKLERELWEYQFMDEEAIWVEATDDVIQLLQGENKNHKKQLEEALHFKILCSTLTSPIPNYRIKHIGSLSSITERLKP